MKAAASLRPSLVATALTESALGNFQHTSLLLSNHADMLCELMIQDVNMDDLVTADLKTEQTVTSADAVAASRSTDRSKRRTSNQPARTVKRTARHLNAP